MAMYTAATLTTEARTALNEPTAYIWADAEIQKAIDRGARLLSGITRCTPIEEAVTTTTDTMYYALTAKFISIESVVFNAVTGMQKLDPIKYGIGVAGGAAADTNRNPLCWWQFGNYLYLWPLPKGTAVGAGLITVYGYRTAYSYEHDSGPAQYDIPDSLQPILLDYVLTEMWAKDHKHAKSHLHFTRFLDAAGFSRIDIHDRELMIDSKDKTKVPDKTVSANQ
jgi:hypothetical protein